MIFEWLNIKRLLLPFIKGLPIIILCTVVALLIAKRSVTYITPKYESTTKVKLDDSNAGIQNTILYKDFNLFHGTNKINTEVEVIKSQTILKKVVDSLNLQYQLKRIGKLKHTTYYNNAPFHIFYAIKDEAFKNHIVDIQMTSNDSIQIEYTLHKQKIIAHTMLGETLNLDAVDLTFEYNPEWLASNDTNAIVGHYQFEIQTNDKVVNNLKSNLTVKPVEKYVPVIRISYKDLIPQKTKDVADCIAAVYIDDYIYTKSERGLKTSAFVQKQLEDVEKELAKTDRAMQQFKEDNEVIDIEVSSETGLKKVAELEVKIANLQHTDVAFKQEKMETLLAEQRAIFNKYPHIIHKLNRYERNFKIDYKTYETLKEKFTESSIAAASTISFHRLLKEAELPKSPISPNKTLIYFASGLLAILTSTLLIYLFHFIFQKVADEYDIEKNSGLSLLGSIPRLSKNTQGLNNALLGIVHQIAALPEQSQKKWISISPLNKNTNNYNWIKKLAQTFAALGWKTLLVDADFNNHIEGSENLGFTDYLRSNHSPNIIRSGENVWELSKGTQSKTTAFALNSIHIKDQLEALALNFDYVIYHCPSFVEDNSCLQIHQLSSLNVLVCQKKYSPIKQIIEGDVFKDKHNLANVQWILNRNNPPNILMRFYHYTTQLFKIRFTLNKNSELSGQTQMS